jgi:hypothetical protein
VCVCLCVYVCGTVPRFFRRRSVQFTRQYGISDRYILLAILAQSIKQADMTYVHSVICTVQPVHT